jgi:hypothetical protein
MSLTARIITPIELPEEIEIEVTDTVRDTVERITVSFKNSMAELGEALGAVDLHEMDAAEFLTLASAVAKHRAIDKYLISIGIDPHAPEGERQPRSD